MYQHLTKLCLMVAIIASSAAAFATVMYNYERGAGVFGGNSQLSFDSVSASFDIGTNVFTFFDGDCSNPDTGCITPVPESSTWLLLLTGFALLLWTRVRQAAQTAASYAALSARIDRQLYASR